jgi:uncharacterized OB-fold protein
VSETYLGFVHDNRMTPELHKFIEGLKENKLYGNQCKKCSKKFMPPRGVCPCGSTDLTWFEEKPEGTLYTWTIVHFAPEAIARKVNVPYAAGVIEFADGLKLLGHMGSLAVKPKVGLKVRVKMDKLDTGDYVYRIVPV